MTSVRCAFALAAALLLSLAGASPAAADEPTWQLEQPAAPPPPPGVAPAPFPVPLGAVGDMAFAAPNRGVLTTAGNGPVPRGLYAYDGVAWHPFATVCGGQDGRLAWAAADELWAVADQRGGQVQGPALLPLNDRSLCRIRGGRVVASYATPQGRSDSWQEMNAAACAAPGDCWFGGTVLRSPPPYGAFHLHWDGSAVTAAPSAAAPVGNDPAHAVLDMASFQGSVFESVAIGADDVENPAAPDIPGSPSWLHLLSADLSNPFLPLTTPVSLGRNPRNLAIRPVDLDAFDLGSDGETLWAVAGSTTDRRANVVVLQADGAGNLAQLRLVADGGELPPFGTRVLDVAAEPGSGAVWIAYEPPSSAGTHAYVARIERDGRVTRSEVVPAEGDPAGPKGGASRIACPAQGDCWLATDRGWLFHLTDGSAHVRDTDPAFAGVITTRPADDGVPFQPPVDPPIDDSLANQRRAGAGGGEQAIDPPRRTTRRPVRRAPLVRGIAPRVLRGTTIMEVRFTLTRRARVTVVASRKRRVVARSRPRAMAKGVHRVRLKLRRDRWPTALAVDARAIPAKRRAAARSSAAVAVTRGGAGGAG